MRMREVLRVDIEIDKMINSEYFDRDTEREWKRDCGRSKRVVKVEERM